MARKPLHRIYSNNSNVISKISEELVTLFFYSMESSGSINMNDNLYFNYLIIFRPFTL